nr:PREDICTED: uncharacterized protein LOC106703204 [Latimeria chalumnae]|eukprot:XP_014343006.1 PREDICTED: uncharacterized protein LOC106703204 [Latimeria chalumnae]
MELMIPKAPPLPPPIKASEAVFEFSDQEAPPISDEFRKKLEWHIKMKRLQHNYSLPLLIQKSIETFMPPAPTLLDFKRTLKPNLVVFIIRSKLSFVSKECISKLELNVKRKIIRNKWGIPKRIQESLNNFIRPLNNPSLADSVKRIGSISNLDLYLSKKRKEIETDSSSISSDAKISEGAQNKRDLNTPAEYVLDSLNSLSKEELSRHLIQKNLEIKLEQIPSNVFRSVKNANPVLKTPLPKCILLGNGIKRARATFILFMEKDVVALIEVNIKQKYLQHLWGIPNSYLKSMEMMIPKAVSLPPPLKSNGSVIEMTSVETPFISNKMRKYLDWHLKWKRLQHKWRLSSLVQTSLKTFTPPSTKLKLSQLHWQETDKVVTTINKLPFISEKTRKKFQFHVKKKTAQNKWGLPKRIQKHLEGFIPSFMLLSEKIERKENKADISFAEKILLGASKPHSKEQGTNTSIFFTLYTLQSENKANLELHLGQKTLEVKKEMMPMMVKNSYKSAYPVIKAPLPKIIQPGGRITRTQATYISFMEEVLVYCIELNIKQKHLQHLWRLPTLYTLSMEKMMPEVPLLPPPIKANGAVIELTDLETPFLLYQNWEMLELHIKQKKLQHLWGLPSVAQKSLEALIPSAPRLIPAQFKPVVPVDIIPKCTSLSFVSENTKKLLDTHLIKKQNHKSYVLPKQIQCSLKQFIPAAPPVPQINSQNNKEQWKSRPIKQPNKQEPFQYKYMTWRNNLPSLSSKTRTIKLYSADKRKFETPKLSTAITYCSKLANPLPDVNDLDQISKTLALHIKQKEMMANLIYMPPLVATSVKLSKPPCAPSLPISLFLKNDVVCNSLVPNFTIPKNMHEITRELDIHVRKKLLEADFGIPPLVIESRNLARAPPAPKLGAKLRRVFLEQDADAVKGSYSNSDPAGTNIDESHGSLNGTEDEGSQLVSFTPIEIIIPNKEEILNDLEFHLKKKLLNENLNFPHPGTQSLAPEVPSFLKHNHCTCLDYPYRTCHVIVTQGIQSQFTKFPMLQSSNIFAAEGSSVLRFQHNADLQKTKEIRQQLIDHIMKKHIEFSASNLAGVRCSELDVTNSRNTCGISSLILEGTQRFSYPPLSISLQNMQSVASSVLRASLFETEIDLKPFLNTHLSQKIIMNFAVLPQCVIESQTIYNDMITQKARRDMRVLRKKLSSELQSMELNGKNKHGKKTIRTDLHDLNKEIKCDREPEAQLEWFKLSSTHSPSSEVVQSLHGNIRYSFVAKGTCSADDEIKLQVTKRQRRKRKYFNDGYHSLEMSKTKLNNSKTIYNKFPCQALKTNKFNKIQSKIHRGNTKDEYYRADGTDLGNNGSVVNFLKDQTCWEDFPASQRKELISNNLSQFTTEYESEVVGKMDGEAIVHSGRIDHNNISSDNNYECTSRGVNQKKLKNALSHQKLPQIEKNIFDTQKMTTVRVWQVTASEEFPEMVPLKPKNEEMGSKLVTSEKTSVKSPLERSATAERSFHSPENVTVDSQQTVNNANINNVVVCSPMSATSSGTELDTISKKEMNSAAGGGVTEQWALATSVLKGTHSKPDVQNKTESVHQDKMYALIREGKEGKLSYERNVMETNEKQAVTPDRVHRDTTNTKDELQQSAPLLAATAKAEIHSHRISYATEKSVNVSLKKKPSKERQKQSRDPVDNREPNTIKKSSIANKKVSTKQFDFTGNKMSEKYPVSQSGSAISGKDFVKQFITASSEKGSAKTSATTISEASFDVVSAKGSVAHCRTPSNKKAFTKQTSEIADGKSSVQQYTATVKQMNITQQFSDRKNKALALNNEDESCATYMLPNEKKTSTQHIRPRTAERDQCVRKDSSLSRNRRPSRSHELLRYQHSKEKMKLKSWHVRPARGVKNEEVINETKSSLKMKMRSSEKHKPPSRTQHPFTIKRIVSPKNILLAEQGAYYSRAIKDSSRRAGDYPQLQNSKTVQCIILKDTLSGKTEHHSWKHMPRKTSMVFFTSSSDDVIHKGRHHTNETSAEKGRHLSNNRKESQRPVPANIDMKIQHKNKSLNKKIHPFTRKRSHFSLQNYKNKSVRLYHRQSSLKNASSKGFTGLSQRRSQGITGTKKEKFNTHQRVLEWVKSQCAL